MKIKMQEKRGITLIALVVTIVIMLILSGVTINMVVGEGGVLKSAQDAKNALQEDIINEQETTQNLVNQLNEIMNENSGTGDEDDTPTEPEEPELPDGWDGTTNDKVTAVQSKDETPVNVPVPKGFTASTVEAEQKVEEGFVIKQDGTNNEFVWIPVSEERLAAMYTEGTATLLGGTGVTTSIYSKLSTTTKKPGEIGAREPDLVVGDDGTSYDANSTYQAIVGASSTQEFAQDMVNEYQEIHDSIEKYGGFYIGRYELTGSVGSPTVQRGRTVIANQNWYNLKAACMKLVNNEGKEESEITAKTTMMYGNQWDEVCNWLSGKGYDINDSTSWGNYSNNTEEGAGTKHTAGYKESWKANNIYDFAGNCWEWTQEAGDIKSRIVHGGDYYDSGSDYPASGRNGNGPSDASSPRLSTRPTLYIM